MATDPRSLLVTNNYNRLIGELQAMMVPALFTAVLNDKIGGFPLIDYILYMDVLPSFSIYFPWMKEHIQISYNDAEYTKGASRLLLESNGLGGAFTGTSGDNSGRVFKLYKLPTFYFDEEQTIIRKPLALINCKHPAMSYNGSSDKTGTSIMASLWNNALAALPNNKANLLPKLITTVDKGFIDLEVMLNVHMDFAVTVGFVTDIEEVDPLRFETELLPYAKEKYKYFLFNRYRNFSEGEIDIGVPINTYISDWANAEDNYKELQKQMLESRYFDPVIFKSMFEQYSP